MIKGFLPFSMVDWPGKLAAVVFVGGCNFRCPWCHNRELAWRPQTFQEVSLPTSLDPWIDGLVITGGEPTFWLDIGQIRGIISHFRRPAMMYTNGHLPVDLECLLPSLSSVSMDVKAPLSVEQYSESCGVKVDISRIKRSIDLLREWDGEVIFRTTHHPGLTDDDILKIKEYLGPGVNHIVQPYREPR